ncbi:MAG: TetR/AcrR family transcriptional regulator [Methanoregula sp.]
MPRINSEYREDAKKKIIAAAIEIAAEKNWDAVTLEAIAQKVGVTKGALYAYFENSEALLREVIFEVFRNVRLGLETTLAQTDDIHRMIRNLADLIFEQQKPYASIFCQLPMRLPQDPKYREEFSHIFDRNRILICEYLAHMKAKGKLSEDVDPESASSMIIAMTMGLRICSLFLGKDAVEAKKTWIDSVERILGIVPEKKG